MNQVNSIQEEYIRYLRYINDASFDCSEELGGIAYLMDVHGLCNIIDFCNKNKQLHWRAHVIFVRLMCLVLYEGFKFYDVLSDVKSLVGDEFTKIKDLRMKVHQFRYRDFKKNLNSIESSMGRSRERLAPMLDMYLEYREVDKSRELFGTNIWLFLLNTEDMQPTVEIMQSYLRKMQKEIPFTDGKQEIQCIKSNVVYKKYSYCYVDIFKECGIESDILIDRLLVSFDELAGIQLLFQDIFEIRELSSSDSYMMFFFVKAISIVYDEAIDNIKGFIANSDRDSKDVSVMNNLLSHQDTQIIDKATIIRNNLHYSKQKSHKLSDAEEVERYFENILTEVDKLKFSIGEVLRINPSKFRLGYYQFLRWAQTPSCSNASVDSIT